MQHRRMYVFLLATLLAFPAGAADIANGIDAWVTPNSGSSFADFAHDPIPAGFFCAGSEPFTGRIHWQGVPLATRPADALRKADTIVQRLDDLVFDEDGRAVSRLQMRALSMKGLEPIQTKCGAFHVTAALGPVQPLTTMEVVQEQAGKGYWSATLGINALLTFTPVRGVTVRPLTLEQAVEIRVDRADWTNKSRGGDVPPAGFVMVDTTGDQVPDTFLPGPSTFFAKASNAAGLPAPGCWDPEMVCHEGGGHCHCTFEPWEYEYSLPLSE